MIGEIILNPFLKGKERIDGFLLKYKSPSCGPSNVKVYTGKQGAIKGKTSGYFVQKIKEYFPYLPVEDEARLKNYRLREIFLTSIFMLASFREAKEDFQVKSVIDFQSRNKYLLMAYSQAGTKRLGRILSSYNKKNKEEVLNKYHIELLNLVNSSPQRRSFINSFEHMFGYFKKKLSEKEKTFFFESLQLYREKRIPMSSIVHLLYSWSLREENEYILNQTLLHPFPSRLLELSDSGRSLDL